MTPGNVVNAETGAVACDHYHQWPDDLDLLRDAGMDAYRFSTSWARVMPDGRTVNPVALDFYDRLVDGMLERGLKPFQTLYHWDLPAALADLGGWANRDTALRFGDYTAAVTARIGDRMAAIATINEPWCVAWLSHFLGLHAPGLRDIRAAARAMHHIMLAHGLGMTALRAAGMKNCGIVLNFERSMPVDDMPESIAAADRHDAIFNRWFIEGLTRGTYPTAILDGFAGHMPDDWQDDMPQIGQKIDWLGINYYFRSLVRDVPDTPWPAFATAPGPQPKTQMGWEIFPDGLHHFLTRMAREYVGDLPLYVTENGIAWDDKVENGAVFDPDRSAFIDAHMQATLRAIKDGANVRGFFYWSLLDNYEWAFGYEKRFGLVHVDFDSLKRLPKASYHALAAALAR